MYVLGMDVGGTKTHCLVADMNSNILGEGFAGKGNYQVCGIETTKESLKMAMDQAIKNSKLNIKDIKYAVLGMAGADEEIDFIVLNEAVESIIEGIPFKIYHDSWIGLSSVSDENVGIVSICGTGSAHSGRNKDGKEAVLRNLDYLLGNYGGGGEVVEKAIHYAFRSNEETYKKTSLEQALINEYKLENMDQVCAHIREYGLSKEILYKIPIITFDQANKGDYVAQMIISNMGKEMGMYAASIVRKLKMQEEEFPAVLVGGLFATKNEILIKSYMDEVKKIAAKAYYIIPSVPPVIGSIKLAIDKLSY